MSSLRRHERACDLSDAELHREAAVNHYRPRKATGKKTGSTMKLDGASTTCSGCGERVVLSGQVPLWFHTDRLGIRTSWHFRCWFDTNAGHGPEAARATEGSVN